VRGKSIDVILERAERNVPEFLARSLADRAPDLGMVEGS
jgi:hypothetical protein